MTEKKLRIVQIIDRLNIGGAERVLVMIANLLQQHGHEVKVITTVSSGPLSKKLNKSIQHINLGRKWKWNVVTMRRLVNELKDFDIVHVHSSHNLRYVYLAMKLFRLRKTIFFHEHYGDIYIDQSVRWHQKLIYPGTVFIGVSLKHTQWALQHLKMPVRKVFLLENTIEKIEVSKIEKKVDDVTQLLLVSNFRTTKNIEYAIELFKYLKDEALYNYQFTVIGRVADESYFQKIKNLITENNLEEHINILTDVDDVQPLLNKFDLAIHTSMSESGPLALIEYMAQGLPFLTYNTGEVVEQVKSKIPLAVMNSFEKYEWVNRVETLLRLPYDDLSSKFTNVYDHYFSTEAYYKKLMEIYENGLLN